MLNEKPANVLTEEELEEWEREPRELLPVVSDYRIKLLIFAYRTLNSRNAKLVHENDELMDENEKLRNLVSLANNLIPSENITWANNLKTLLEELNHE